MTALAKISLILGGVLIPAYMMLVFIPATFRKWLVAFPRSKWLGRILATVGMVWVGWLFYTMPLGQFDRMRPVLCGMTPVVLILMIVYMDELLAPRALGGLILLIPAPLLGVARWHESPWRLVIVVIAYIIIIKGMILVLNPYMFRKSVQFWLKTDLACRIWGLTGLAMAFGVVALGLMVF
ncbi:MAG: hypothetical protein KAH23_03480 [Kiritimatiellae bacterium]|nr:hypothetical protein [Kiritimatiellia bacterium]